MARAPLSAAKPDAPSAETGALAVFLLVFLCLFPVVLPGSSWSASAPGSSRWRSVSADKARSLHGIKAHDGKM
jgi:hypothetical protein